MRGFQILVSAVVLTALWAAPAYAQPSFRPRALPPQPDFRPSATVFAGMVPNPAIRGGFGFAFGGGFPGSGFELEIARTASRLAKGAPSLATYGASFFVDTPGTVGRFKVYLIGGLGVWSEQFEPGRGAGELGVNVGAGLKTTLIGAIKARFDYRLFFLKGSPDGTAEFPHPNRFYVGLCAGC